MTAALEESNRIPPNGDGRPLPQPAHRFYVVESSMLPEAARLTAVAKEVLARGEAATVGEACAAVGLSRSAFYKYRDNVFPFNETSRGRVITVRFKLAHRRGVLHGVLGLLAVRRANILTIYQGLPMDGLADVHATFETESLEGSIEKLMQDLAALDGVVQSEIVGRS